MSLNIVTREETVPDQIKPVTFTAIDDSDPGLYPVEGHLYDSGYINRFEAITPNSDRHRHVWKNFSHYLRIVPQEVAMGEITCTTDTRTRNWSNGVGKVSGGTLFTNATFGPPWMPNVDIQVYYDPLASDGVSFVPAPADIDTWKQNSLRAMMPTVKSELSILNSIIELKDFKRLPSQVRGVQSLLRGSLAHNYVRLINPRLAKVIRSVPPGLTLARYVREVAGGYLQAKFNIMPLISDIRGIYASIVASNRRLNDLINRQGRPRVSHFTKRFVEEVDRDEFSSVVGFGGVGGHYGIWSTDTNITGSGRMHRTVTNQATVFHSQLEYNYNYSKAQVAFAPLLSMLDRLGIQNNPAIIWNAIPWSFVVDWVAGVGRYLDSMKNGWMDPEINILRYLWSIKRSRMICQTREIQFDRIYGVNSPDYYQKVLSLVVNESAYRRTVEPPTSASIVTSGLNPNEFTLGAALCFAQARYRGLKR